MGGDRDEEPAQRESAARRTSAPVGAPGAVGAVVVVGAGIAGLLAAHVLAEAGHPVVVVDKGRVVGGRLATRLLPAGPHGTAVADDGAQFFTARSADLAPLLASWLERGVAEPWFEGRPDGTGLRGREVHYRGRDGMAALARDLAVGLDVRSDAVVTKITTCPGADAGTDCIGSLPCPPGGRHWRILLRSSGVATVLEAPAVVVTAPVPESLALFVAGGARLAADDEDVLRSVTYTRCLAVTAVLDGPSGMEPPGARRVGGPVVDWVADNCAKGISPWPVVTVHAGPRFSADHWADSDSEIARVLLHEVGLGGRHLATPPPPASGDASRVAGPAVERWLYAKPVGTAPGELLVLDGLPPAVLAGDGFGGPRVESAALSGIAAGRAAATLLA